MAFLSKYHKIIMVMQILILGLFGSPAYGNGIMKYDPDISGKIVNHDTRRAMEGVVVSAVWFYDQFRLTEAPKRTYYDYFETLTDQDGNFKIPGKGLCIIRNIYPPTITIFKAGYSILHLEKLVPHIGQDFPSGDEVKWGDGKATIIFREKSLKERRKYCQTNEAVPLSQMVLDGVPPRKIRLYIREIKKEYEGTSMINDYRHLRYKEGGVFPAKEGSSKRKSSE